MEYTYLPNVFYTTLHTSLTLIFIYSRYASIVAKLITLQISQLFHVFCYFAKFSSYQKIFQVKVLNLSEVYILSYTYFISHDEPFEENL